MSHPHGSSCCLWLPYLRCGCHHSCDCNWQVDLAGELRMDGWCGTDGEVQRGQSTNAEHSMRPITVNTAKNKPLQEKSHGICQLQTGMAGWKRVDSLGFCGVCVLAVSSFVLVVLVTSSGVNVIGEVVLFDSDCEFTEPQTFSLSRKCEAFFLRRNTGENSVQEKDSRDGTSDHLLTALKAVECGTSRWVVTCWGQGSQGRKMSTSGTWH